MLWVLTVLSPFLAVTIKAIISLLIQIFSSKPLIKCCVPLLHAYVSAESLQSYPTLCNSVNYSPQASLSIGFSRQEYCSESSCRPLRDLPNPGIKPTSLLSPALASGFFTTSATWEAHSPTTALHLPCTS